MLLYFLRHGEPIYNPDSLTKKGQVQAELLSQRLSMYKIDKIYSSTSVRAYQTALPTAQKLGLEIEKLDWCHENYTGDEFSVPKEDNKRIWFFEDEKTLEVFNSKEVYDLGFEWYEHPYFKNLLAKKGVQRINREVDNFFLALGYKHDRETRKYESIGEHPSRIALFAHGGFGMAFLSSLLDIPYPTFALHFQYLCLSGMTVIDFNDRKEICPKIIEYSNDSHLYKADLKPFHGYKEF